MKSLSVLLTDSNDIFRTGLASIVNEVRDVDNICSAKDEREIFALLLNVKVDFLCLDLDMPKLNCDSLIRSVRSQFPSVRIIVFSSYFNLAQLRSLLNHGVNSFLNKSASPLEIQEVITALVKSHKYFSSESQKLLMMEMHRQEPMEVHNEVLMRELLFLISHELTIREIAVCLGLTDKTIEYHRMNLFKKIGAKNMVGLALYAYRSNIYFDVALQEKFQKWIRPQRLSV